MKLPNLFTFFFTHTAQAVDDNSKVSFYLYSYLNFENLITTEVNEHGFYFAVSNNQPSGNITITAENYEATLTTPFNNPVFESTDTSLNPLIITPIDYESDTQFDNATVLATITVDSNNVNVSNTNFEDIYLSPSTVDTDSYIFYKNENTLVDLDSVIADNTSYLVSLDNVPDTNTKIEWLVNDKLSSLWCPTSKRGYLPGGILVSGNESESATLSWFGQRYFKQYLYSNGASSTTNSVTLTDIALGLLTLINYNQDYLILSTLRELTYVWGNNTSINKNGLPSLLYRYQNNDFVYTKARNTSDLALLGYAITSCINYLRDKQIDKITPINNDIVAFIDNICSVVCSLINKSAGYASVGYGIEGEILDQQSHASLIISQIFLHKFLSVRYSYATHSICNAAYLAISNRSLRRGNFQDLIYKLYWNIIYNQHYDTQDIYDKLKAQIEQTEEVFVFSDNEVDEVLGVGVENEVLGLGVIKTSLNLNEFYLGLWVLCNQLLTSKQIQITEQVVLPPLNNLYLQKHNELYSSTSTPLEVISLLSSSWIKILTNENSLIRQTPTFVLYSEPSLAHHAFGFQESKRLLPFGYKWASLKSEEAFSGIIGSYLYALSFPTRDWFLVYSLLKSGRYLSTSQGYALDNWGDSVNLPRPTLQSDTFYRNNIKYFLTRQQSTLTSLQQVIQRIYSEQLEITEVLPVKYIDGLFTYPFNKTSEVINKIKDTNTIMVNKPFYPSISLITQGLEQQVNWENYLPRLEVVIDSSIPGLETSIKNEISAGINVAIFLRQKHTVNNRPFTSALTSIS